MIMLNNGVSTALTVFTRCHKVKRCQHGLMASATFAKVGSEFVESILKLEIETRYHKEVSVQVSKL